MCERMIDMVWVVLCLCILLLIGFLNRFDSRKLANSNSVQGITRALIVMPTYECCSAGGVSMKDQNEPPRVCHCIARRRYSSALTKPF